MTTRLRQRMIEDMQLRGLAERTQEMYVIVVRQLAEHYGKSPDLITEEELRQYFLYLKNDKHYSRSTITVALRGIKFFYEHMLQREWPTLAFGPTAAGAKAAGRSQPPRSPSHPGLPALAALILIPYAKTLSCS